MWATALLAQVKQDDPWLPGVGVGPEPGLHSFDAIVVGREVVKKVWNYRVQSHEGSFVLPDHPRDVDLTDAITQKARYYFGVNEYEDRFKSEVRLLLAAAPASEV